MRRRPKAPLNVEFNITNKCNLRCIHCKNTSGKASESELTTPEIKKVIDQLSDINVFYLGIGGGEPLMHNDFLEILEYACSKKNLKTGIVTNGTLLDEKIVITMKKLGVYLVRISLDGHDAYTHNSFRGADSFDKTIQAIKCLHKHDVKTTVLHVLSKHNVNSLDKLVDKCIDIGAKSLNIITFVQEGRGLERPELELSPEEYKKFLKKVVKLKELDSIRILTETPLLHVLEGSTEFGATCLAGNFMMIINEIGDITPCSHFQSPIGNIRQDTLLDVWQNSKFLKELCDPEHLSEFCKKCKFSESCFGGCRAAAFQVFGTISSPDPFCWIFQREKGNAL